MRSRSRAASDTAASTRCAVAHSRWMIETRSAALAIGSGQGDSIIPS